MKPVFMVTRDNFEHAFYIDRFSTSWIDYAAFLHSLEQGCQIVLVMKRQENIGIEIHKHY